MVLEQKSINAISLDEFKKWIFEIFKECIEKNLITTTSQADFKEEYYSRRQLCKVLGYSYPTIQKLHNEGCLQGRRFGNTYRYSKKLIDKLFSELDNMEVRRRRIS